MEKVIVTTEFRGVFFGSLSSREGREVVLHDARFVMRWGTGSGDGSGDGDGSAD